MKRYGIEVSKIEKDVVSRLYDYRNKVLHGGYIPTDDELGYILNIVPKFIQYIKNLRRKPQVANSATLSRKLSFNFNINNDTLLHMNYTFPLLKHILRNKKNPPSHSRKFSQHASQINTILLHEKFKSYQIILSNLNILS